MNPISPSACSRRRFASSLAASATVRSRLRSTTYFAAPSTARIRTAAASAARNRRRGFSRIHCSRSAACAAVGVTLVEQPLPAGQDQALARITRPLTVCADESVHDRASLESLRDRYDAVNIKLDKTGGLTEALILAREARVRGMGLMMGCNGATSLGNAPGYVVGSLCDWRDVDSQELLYEDRANGMITNGGELYAFDSKLWG